MVAPNQQEFVGPPAAAPAAAPVAAGSGFGPVLASAGLSSAAGLFMALMQQNAAKKAAEEQAKRDREAAARARLAQAEQNQLNTVKDMGQNEQSAINNLMAALMRTAR